MNDIIRKRLELIRTEMVELQLDAYVIPHADEYLGEYVPPQNERLAWISGFTGSAGTVVVLKNSAAIFVDGRYTLQVRQQVSSDAFQYHHLISEPPVHWLAQNLSQGARVGVDSRMHTYAWFSAAKQTLAESTIDLVEVLANPIDRNWHDRPIPEQQLAMLLGEEFTGEHSETKRARIAGTINRVGADVALITQLDSIAWLLNIRGLDVPRLPVILAFATLDKTGSMVVYTDPRKLPNDFSNHVGPGVTLCDASELQSALSSLSGLKVMADPTMANAWCQLRCLDAGASLIDAPDPVLIPKAQKNSTELNGMRNCHVRDGSAVTRYLSWIDREVSANRLYNEAELASKLESFRLELTDIHDFSFDTISAAGSNAAMAHYNHNNGTPAMLELNNLYLVDSGGQYSDGTTDITRTVIIGTPSAEHKKMFTLVLKGHIALARAVFPKGTSGMHLDAFARQFLWQEGFDYDHGTGHGVGAFLSVHEGPQRISKAGSQQELLPGMVISNEPGYYQEDSYGIRCENLVIVIEKDNGMLGFETITFAPFDIRLIDVDLMAKDELDWLNNYHETVREKLTVLLSAEDRDWLDQSTVAVA